MTTLQGIGALIVSLPRLFDVCLVPATLVTVLLAFSRRTRSAAALSFLTIAALSASLLSITAASFAYLGWRFGHLVFEMLQNLGPAATFDFLVSLLRVAGVRPIDFAFIVATGTGSGIAAVALGRARADRLRQAADSLAPP